MLLKLSSTGTTGCYDSTVSVNLNSRLLNKITWHNTNSSNITPTHLDTLLNESYQSPTDQPISCASSGTNCYVVYNGPTLCGKAAPIFASVALDPITACTDSTFFAVSKGTVLYNNYSDSLTGNFEQKYLQKCLQAYKQEVFTVSHSQHEYHYTLYYYDQAGNLLKTVPPAGVEQHTDSVWLSQVRAARAAGSVLRPAHKLSTDYRYNTLNQVVAQHTPDAGGSYFWYDRLGRLVLSQNARQKPNNQYSYTQYDSLGRITQVGQLVSGTGVTDLISRSEASLTSWENAVAASADQITATTYDSANYFAIPALTPHNLRNRVAWTALYNTNADLVAIPGNHAAASYYSYDILGNVDTLVQDYKLGSMANQRNRFKKIIYDYDLVSGKVNRVAYQRGQSDAFYHSYVYDAENRITNVQTSTDSINWDNDAFYSYYAHGPLARTVLGEQQVQGINYAYTLQGWLKAINPDIYTGGSFTLRPDSSNNVVAATAYNVLLNYFNGDYSPVSAQPGSDNGVSATLGSAYRPLFNGNISSMGVNVRKLDSAMLYNYQYDQLNRLVGMDAWRRTGAAWSAIGATSSFQERIGYDPNGNILGYHRNGKAATGLDMDKMRYVYTPGTNKLDHIYDTVPSTAYPADIDAQDSLNYKYDSIGELVYDGTSRISNISWTVYGKIASITKGDSMLLYTYDPGGNRISKSVVHGVDTLTIWYVRDGQGNVLSVYTYGDPAVHGKALTQAELHLYGSSRLGILRTNNDVYDAPVNTTSLVPLLGTGDSVTFNRGNKLFELTNHLGNVLATISDKRFGIASDSVVRYFIPEVVSANDYYPFGMLQPGRSYPDGGNGYRYGFNGKEKDDETKGVGDQIDYGMRGYDPRVGRFLSLDPLTNSFPFYTPYQYTGNSPIAFIDLDGKERLYYIYELDEKSKRPKLTDYVVQTHEEGNINNFVDYLKDPTRSNPTTPQRRAKYDGDLISGCSEVYALKLGADLYQYFDSYGELAKNGQTSPGHVDEQKLMFAYYGEAAMHYYTMPSDFFGGAGSSEYYDAHSAANASRNSPEEGIMFPRLNGIEINEIAPSSMTVSGKQEIVGMGQLDEGVLSLGIFMKKGNTNEYLLNKGALTGSDVFDIIVSKVKVKGGVINTIQGNWSGNSDNLNRFNTLIKTGMSPVIAAEQTFTGSQAIRHGYKKVSIDYSKSKVRDDGTFEKAVVNYNKE